MRMWWGMEEKHTGREEGRKDDKEKRMWRKSLFMFFVFGLIIKS